MATYNAEITTPWIGTGAIEDSNRPLAGDVYPVPRWQDITGQAAENLTPTPNIYVLLVVVGEDMLDLIDNDPAHVVLWAEEIIEETA